MKNIFAAGLIAFAIGSPAFAQDQPAQLTLNDLPRILYKLRDCQETKTLVIFPNGSTCRLTNSDLWASVDSTGGMTLFRQKSYGDTTYAKGRTVADLLRDLARQLNEERAQDKAILDAVASFLPTQ